MGREHGTATDSVDGGDNRGGGASASVPGHCDMTGPLADRRHLDPTLCVRCGLGARRRRDDGTRGQWCGVCFAAVVALLSRNNARRRRRSQPVPVALEMVPAPLIECRYAPERASEAGSTRNPCGQFGTDLHQAAAKAGACCTVAAFDLTVAEVAATGQIATTWSEATQHDGQPDWAPFDPSDDDVPGGAW